MYRHLRDIDSRLFLRMARLESRKLLMWLRRLSHSADGYLYAALPLLVYIASPADLKTFVAIAVPAFTIELMLYYLIKRNVRRARPFQQLRMVQQRIRIPDQFSFPSGHTSAAFVTAGLLSHFFPVVLIPVYSWASLVGLSRIYLGVHYPTDVLAGAAIGFFSLTAGVMLFG